MLGFHMCHWAWHVQGSAHLLSLHCLNLRQLWIESGTHLLVGEQREFSAHPFESDFDPGTFRTTSKCMEDSIPIIAHIMCAHTCPLCKKPTYTTNIKCVNFFSAVDLCGTNPCQNGGQCTNFCTHYTCSCPPCWSGTNCDIRKFTRQSWLICLKRGAYLSKIDWFL